MNWKIAEDIAAEHGRTMQRSNLRLMGPMHIAETREQARANVRFGLIKYLEYARTVIPGRFGDFAGRDLVDVILDSRHIVIGTPHDAVSVLNKLRMKQGEFGAFLQQANDWADWEATKKSYELFQLYVAPHFGAADVAHNASPGNLPAETEEPAAPTGTRRWEMVNGK